MAKPSAKSAPSRNSKTVNPEHARHERAGQEQQRKNETKAISPQQVQPVGSIQPRIIRLKDAPRYLGMNRNLFNKEVRPGLVTVPIGQQGIGFDRLDLDAWVDAYKQRNGAPGSMRGISKCEIPPDSNLMGSNGLSTSASRTLDAFSKELALAKKRVKKR